MNKSRIALLVHQTAEIEDGNYARFAQHLIQQGYDVDLCSVDSLRMLAGRIVVNGFQWQSTSEVGDSFPALTTLVLDHDKVWILALGDRTNFLDKYQLLYALPETTQLVNSLAAIMHLKSKFFLATRPEVFPSPETYGSSDAAELVGIVQENPGRWIVKPPAGSLGRDVFLTDDQDTNLSAIITNLCGPLNNQYTLLQRYVPEIENGEKRILVAGGIIIDQYRRTATQQDHRTNVHQGATVSTCSLSAQEQALCERLAATLLRHGARFAGIDLAYPWLIEVNVINPGGITTIESLTGQDRTQDVLNAVLATV